MTTSARKLAPIALLLSAALLITGCSGSSKAKVLPDPTKAFCDKGKEYEALITSGKKIGVDEQLAIVREINANAPKDIAADTQVFLSALERVARGDKSVVDDEQVQESIVNVNRRFAQGCGLFDRKSAI
jgi:hypothetical protein